MCYIHAAALVAEYLKRKGKKSSFESFYPEKLIFFMTAG